jgi:autotransporter passenger strand-loop-strand repeat protein
MFGLTRSREPAGKITRWRGPRGGQRLPNLRRQRARRASLGVEGLEQRAVPAATVGSGQIEVVAAGQTLTGVTVLAGGYLLVQSGGTAVGTTDNGGSVSIAAGGKSLGAPIADEGDMEVFGLASGTVLNGGDLGADPGGTVTGSVVNGGDLYIDPNSTAINTTINTGGSVTLIAGGTASGTTIDGGTEYVRAGAVTNGTTVNAGGTEYVFAGGVARSLTVGAGGSATMLGTTDGATINNGGTLTVFDGGSATGSILDNGTLAFNTSGTSTFAGSLTGGGTLAVQGGGKLVVSGALNSKVAVTVGTNSALELGAAANANVTFGFQAALTLDHSQSFTGTLAGMAAGNQARLDLADVPFIKGVTTVQLAENPAHTQGVLTVSDQANGGPTVQLTLAGDYTGAAFSAQADGATGTVITVGATPATPPPGGGNTGGTRNITSLVKVSPPSSVNSLGGGLFLVSFTITNTSAQSILGPIRLSFPNLPAGVSVLATTSIAGLAPGQSDQLTLEFLDTSGFDLTTVLTRGGPVNVLAG